MPAVYAIEGAAAKPTRKKRKRKASRDRSNTALGTCERVQFGNRAGCTIERCKGKDSAGRNVGDNRWRFQKNTVRCR